MQEESTEKAADLSADSDETPLKQPVSIYKFLFLHNFSSFLNFKC